MESPNEIDLAEVLGNSNSYPISVGPYQGRKTIYLKAARKHRVHGWRKWLVFHYVPAEL